MAVDRALVKENVFCTETLQDALHRDGEPGNRSLRRHSRRGFPRRIGNSPWTPLHPACFRNDDDAVHF